MKYDISFDIWKKNHPPDHLDLNNRLKYPWDLFGQIDFSQEMSGTIQMLISDEGYNFRAKILNAGKGINARDIFDILLFSKISSNKYRLVFEESYFITAFEIKRNFETWYVNQFKRGNLEHLEISGIPKKFLSILPNTLLETYMLSQGFEKVGRHWRKSKQAVFLVPHSNVLYKIARKYGTQFESISLVYFNPYGNRKYREEAEHTNSIHCFFVTEFLKEESIEEFKRQILYLILLYRFSQYSFTTIKDLHKEELSFENALKILKLRGEEESWINVSKLV